MVTRGVGWEQETVASGCCWSPPGQVVGGMWRPWWWWSMGGVGVTLISHPSDLRCHLDLFHGVLVQVTVTLWNSAKTEPEAVNGTGAGPDPALTAARRDQGPGAFPKTAELRSVCVCVDVHRGAGIESHCSWAWSLVGNSALAGDAHTCPRLGVAEPCPTLLTSWCPGSWTYAVSAWYINGCVMSRNEPETFFFLVGMPRPCQLAVWEETILLPKESPF